MGETMEEGGGGGVRVKHYLIRHAKAGRREPSSTSDRSRPLTRAGEYQARCLVEQFDGQRVERILSSPHLRCRQTVEPLAERRGLAIEIAPWLAEETPTASVLKLVARLDSRSTVLCSHGDVIPSLVAELAPELPEAECQKGSTWVLEGTPGALRPVAYWQPPGRGEPQTARLAVLDLGSTSFHLLVADLGADGSLERVTRRREMLRLGALVTEGGEIPRPVEERVVATAVELQREAEEAGASELIAVATAAFRSARNGERVARRLATALGCPVRVLTGQEEARAIFSAFRRRAALGSRPVLGADLGGGSLELAIGNAGGVSAELTLPLGAARLQSEFQKPDPLPASAVRELRSRISEVLAPALVRLRASRVSDHIAAGGTARALARVLIAREKNPPDSGIRNLVIARAALSNLTEQLLASSHAERLTMPGMDPRRADLLPIGAAVLDGLLRDLGARSLSICDWGLREGILLDAARERFLTAQCAEWSQARAQLV